MINNDARLDTLERAIAQMSDQVGKVAEYMERLVKIEERNAFMIQQHKELKDSFKESVTSLNTRQIELEKTVRNLETRMVSFVATFSTISAIASILAPYVIRAVLGG